MESIYYVMSFACHRKCRHCYDDRFRPYVRGELEAIIEQAVRNHARIVDHLPERMTYLDTTDARPDGSFVEKTGRVILSGGEALIDTVRQAVAYPVIERLRRKYAANGGVKVVVQTTGDILTAQIVDELLERGVWMISVASIDDYHVGLEGEAKQKAFVEKLSLMFERAGMRKSGLSALTRNWHEEAGPVYGFFGATPDSWIGKLWPRGRAWDNSLSRATLADNFCNRWSGGLNFLRHRYDGSEVSIEPTGDVYPCCIKTKLPIGNLLEDPLLEILDSLAGVPAYEAITMGHPERMGLAYGWSEARFIEASRTVLPDGTPYQNLCVGCDRFHEEKLRPVLEQARARRRSAEGLAPEPAVPRIVLDPIGG